MKLGFDVDEVLCDLTDSLINYLNDVYDFEWTKDNFKNYGLMENFYTEDSKFNEEIAKDILEKANNEEFQFNACSYEGAGRSLRKYRHQGHTIHLISSRPGKNAKELTAKWCRKHKIPFDTIHTIGHDREKGQVGRVLNLDMYVDDLEKHLHSMWRYKKRWRKGLLLFDRPWNRGSFDASKFTRVYGWQDIDRNLGIQNR